MNNNDQIQIKGGQNILTATIKNNVRPEQIQDENEQIIIHQCEQSGTLYNDPDFPADQTSLSKCWDKMPRSIKQQWSTFQWLRANQISSLKNCKVFEKEIEPNDIKQGLLGDCYLLSSLSALAERPHLISRLFDVKDHNKHGVYGLWLFDQGVWKNILIDDRFPCTAQGIPAFSRAHGPELWVLLLEKAYANLYGSYERIEGGNPAIALRDLTGAPFFNKDEGTPEELWEFIQDSEENHYILTCYTKPTNSREEENDLGVLSGHAYAILDAQQVVDVNNQTQRILQIRNPWGKVEWKGDWSDESHLWTNELKKRLNVVKADDGIFWISIQDFRKYFEGIGICKLHEDFKNSYKKIDFVENVTGKNNITRVHLMMKLEKKQRIFITLNQKDDRYFDPSTNYEYAYMRMLIGKLSDDNENNSITFIGGDYQQNRNLTIGHTYQPGNYVITVEAYWRQNLDRSIIIDAYGEEFLDFVLYDNCEEEVFKIQRAIIRDYAVNINPKEQKRTIYNEHQGFQRLSHFNFGLLYMHYSNQNNHNIQETLVLETLENVCLQQPFQLDQNGRIDLIIPSQRELVLILMVELFSDDKIRYKFKSGVQQYNESIKNLPDYYVDINPQNRNCQVCQTCNII